MTSTRVILLSCGSYNPPTNMHLRMFEIARDHLHRMGTYNVVGGVISPVHDNYSKKELIHSEHRCAMLKCALQNNDWIRVSKWETHQNDWTKTRLVLQHHQNLLNAVLLNPADITSQDLEWIPESIRNSNDRTPIKIKLLCGADLLESFGVPGLWLEEDIDSILSQHGLVVITREGSNPNKFIYDSDILSRHMHNIYIVTEWICNEVSSTKIRRALKRGESIRYLIQDAVIDYIQSNHLYNTTTSTKLTLSSPNNDNNYLHIDSKYESAFLTPSPSDIIMATPSPVEIISIDIAESVIKKNLINLPKTQITTAMSIDTVDGAEFIPEKFMNFMSENGNKIPIITPIKSSYPGQAKQIIATETGESQIFREVGSDHEIGTNIENNCINDIEENLDSFKDNCSNLKCEIEENTISESNFEIDSNILSSVSGSETIRPDVGITDNTETLLENIDNSIKSEISVENQEKPSSSSFSASKNVEVEEKKSSSPSSTFGTSEEKKDKSLSDRNTDSTVQSRKSLVDSSSHHREIDGKYRKSVVNSRKSPKRGNNLNEQVVPKMKNAKNSKKMKTSKKDTRNINVASSKSKPNEKNYLGSLESINANKPITLTKKSKSFEFIKTDFSLKEININDIDTTKTPQKSSSLALMSDKNENETIDEFCSVCCYGKNQSFSKDLYTVHSNDSSPLELDLTECDLCSTYNLQEADAIPGEPQCGRCEICGDIAQDDDVVASSRPEGDDLINARMLANSQHIPLAVAKRKMASGGLQMEGKMFDITDEEVEGGTGQSSSYPGERLPSTSTEEFSADDSTLDDVEFEIENCGLEPEIHQSSIANISDEPSNIIEEITNEELDNEKIDLEIKRMTRGSSLITRSTLRPDSKRRYSSVDNLPSSKQRIGSTSHESKKLVPKNESKTIGSVDNIRVSRITKNASKMRKSADDVAKASQDTNECTENATKVLSRSKSLKISGEPSHGNRVGPDTVKFIIGKRGLKIISDRETSL